jgi:hypothetical protein
MMFYFFQGMEEVSIDDYCSLDDSSRAITGRQIPKGVRDSDARIIPSALRSRKLETYVSSLYYPSFDEYASLVFIKPAKARINERILFDFVSEFIGDGYLIACMHYSNYPSFKDLPRVEFTTKPIRKARGYPKAKKEIFDMAHRESNRKSREVRDLLVRAKHWNYMLDAVREKAETVKIREFELYLAGFPNL